MYMNTYVVICQNDLEATVRCAKSLITLVQIGDGKFDTAQARYFVLNLVEEFSHVY